MIITLTIWFFETLILCYILTRNKPSLTNKKGILFIATGIFSIIIYYCLIILGALIFDLFTFLDMIFLGVSWKDILLKFLMIILFLGIPILTMIMMIKLIAYASKTQETRKLNWFQYFNIFINEGILNRLYCERHLRDNGPAGNSAQAQFGHFGRLMIWVSL